MKMTSSGVLPALSVPQRQVLRLSVRLSVSTGLCPRPGMGVGAHCMLSDGKLESEPKSNEPGTPQNCVHFSALECARHFIP